MIKNIVTFYQIVFHFHLYLLRPDTDSSTRSAVHKSQSDWKIFFLFWSMKVNLNQRSKLSVKTLVFFICVNTEKWQTNGRLLTRTHLRDNFRAARVQLWFFFFFFCRFDFLEGFDLIYSVVLEARLEPNYIKLKNIVFYWNCNCECFSKAF